MTILSTFGGASSVDTGDIPASLRFRSGASAYLSRTFGTPTDNKKWTWSGWVKRGALPAGAYNLLSGGSGGSNDASLMLDANGSLWLYYWTGSYVFSLTAAAFSRDPTSHVHLVVAYDSTQAQTGHSASDSRVRFYLNGVQVSSTGTLPSQNYASNQINAAVGHRLGYTVASSYPFDGYLSRIAFVDGQALTPSSFGYLNTEINEWVSKSQSAVKAVVDAGGTNSFMLDFDDGTSLTTLGYDKSSKGNNWTLNNFSLTAGTTYDWMLDVPGNSFATLNNIHPSAANITNGNLTSGTTAVRATMNALSFDSKWEVTAGASAVTAGVISGTGTATTTSVTANKTFAFRLTTSGALDYKNVTDAGSWTSITTGLSGEQYPYGVTQAANWNFGQAPLHASATYQSAAGGYFYDTTTGYKALCQRNMPDPAILNPENGFVSVLATEDNIYSALAAARSGWTDYVDILKNRAASESWAWQFSHDSSNEYAVAASSLVRQTKRTQSGSNNWVGYSIRIGATYGTAAGSVSHTNGAATTITHNIGKSARQLILLFNRAGGSAVPVCHPDLTSGELLDLCTTAADAASTAITSVGTNSFQIGSGVATGTYDYLVCSEISQFFDLGKWTGNAAADGAYYNADHKPKMLYAKSLSTTDDHRVYDDLRPGYNVQGGVVLANTNAAETTAAEMDITAFGMKARIATTPNAAQTYVTASWASVASKYSLAR
jgi:hypothetical protein